MPVVLTAFLNVALVFENQQPSTVL